MAGLRHDAKATLGQFIRFGLSGVAINIALYLVYLGLTYAGLTPLLAATAVFAMGIPISLWVHGRVSFRARPANAAATALFWGAYIVGYAVQMGVLAGLHHGLGVAHALAQLIAMGIVALTLFLIQKKLVFRV